MKSEITLTVNETQYIIAVEPRKTLADALREDCNLTGTHVGCEHGVCGACTITADGRPMRACLMFAVQAVGLKLRTVEGLTEGKKPHPLQSAFMKHHALQCGFCTPGFLMLALSAFEQGNDVSEEGLRDLLSSNLCRCTGYENILIAVRAAAEEIKSAQ